VIFGLVKGLLAFIPHEGALLCCSQVQFWVDYEVAKKISKPHFNINLLCKLMLKMEALYSSETLVTIYQPTWYNIQRRASSQHFRFYCRPTTQVMDSQFRKQVYTTNFSYLTQSHQQTDPPTPKTHYKV
jgi:hypothetical protein